MTLIDIILSVCTGGLWLIVVLIRNSNRKSKMQKKQLKEIKKQTKSMRKIAKNSAQSNQVVLVHSNDSVENNDVKKTQDDCENCEVVEDE